MGLENVTNPIELTYRIMRDETFSGRDAAYSARKSNFKTVDNVKQNVFSRKRVLGPGIVPFIIDCLVEMLSNLLA